MCSLERGWRGGSRLMGGEEVMGRGFKRVVYLFIEYSMAVR
jgi:hypothetical protein